MLLSRRALLVLALLLLVPVPFIVAGGQARTADAVPTPFIASPGVELVTSVPGSASISGEFSPSAPFFYTSGLDAISVFDVSDPKAPKLTGKLANLVFENEAMSYGERRGADGKVVRRFVLVGIDLYQVTPDVDRTSISRNLGGQQVMVVDVTDPTHPKIAGKTPGSSAQGGVTTGAHTVQCLSLTCDYAYTSGDGDAFSIVDLRNLDKPVQAGTAKSPAGQPNPVFTSGSGHYWDIDEAGIAWHTGSGGVAAFDISDPLAPKALAATNPEGAAAPLNDFIHHNSMRPNARSFKAGAAPALKSGNVAIVTEEDYFNDGDEVACDRSGTLQTWSVPDLDGETYRAGNPGLETGRGTMAPLDSFQAPAEAGGGATTPVGGFCSAHWFDYHQSGVIAQGWYQQGVRFIDVNDPTALKQSGVFTPGASEVWDAYWVPARNEDGTVKADREKTNIVYTADLVRGIDVLEVTNLPQPVEPEPATRPGQDPMDPATTPGAAAAPAPPGSQAPAPPGSASGSRPAGGPRSAEGSPNAASSTASAKACGAPTSRLGRGSVLRRSGARLRGSAQPAAGCALRSVAVAVGRKIGSRCRFLRADGTFGAPRSCTRTQYIAARGTKAWSLDLETRLPRGSYDVWSRATGTSGPVERKAPARNLRRLSVIR